MVAGNKEGPEVDRRMRIAKKLIKKNSLTIAKEAKHRIGQKEYLAGLKRAIDTIE